MFSDDAQVNMEDVEEYLIVELYSYPAHEKKFTLPYKFRTQSGYAVSQRLNPIFNNYQGITLENENEEQINIYHNGIQVGTFGINGLTKKQFQTFEDFDRNSQTQRNFLRTNVLRFLPLGGGAKKKSPTKKSPKKKSPSGKSAYTKTLMAWRKKLSKKDYPSITDVSAYVKKNKLYKASPRRRLRGGEKKSVVSTIIDAPLKVLEAVTESDKTDKQLEKEEMDDLRIEHKLLVNLLDEEDAKAKRNKYKSFEYSPGQQAAFSKLSALETKMRELYYAKRRAMRGVK